MFSEETSVFSVECYFAMFSDIAKTGSGSSRALSELVEFIFPLPGHGVNKDSLAMPLTCMHADWSTNHSAPTLDFVTGNAEEQG